MVERALTWAEEWAGWLGLAELLGYASLVWGLVGIRRPLFNHYSFTLYPWAELAQLPW